MTTISNMTADAFVKRPPRDMRFFLVHGSDEGLVHERVKALVGAALQGAADPLRLIRLDGDAVARDPGALADEVYAVSMFGGARAVWIEAQARDLLPALTPLFARPPVDCTIVVEAGSLKRGTALRGAFEKADNAASIECYPDDRRTLGPLIEAEARAAGMTIAAEARDYLVGLMGSDRGATRGEIAKLILYARGKDAHRDRRRRGDRRRRRALVARRDDRRRAQSATGRGSRRAPGAISPTAAILAFWSRAWRSG